MATLQTEDVGRLWVPELDAFTFRPGRTTGTRSPYVGIVTYNIHDGRTGLKTQAGYGLAVQNDEGLFERWLQSDALQRTYPTFKAFMDALRWRARYGDGAPLPSGIEHNEPLIELRDPLYGFTHNERVNVGGAMIGAAFFGNSLTPTHATVNAPNRIALSNLVSLAAAAGDQSLGTATADSTTNEVLANGLVRTSALTPTSVVAQTALDGNASDVITNTFTDTTATTSTYGAALMDNTTGSFNMFAEATYATAVTAIGDTLAVSWARHF